ncbi:heme-binding protein [Streptomyces sp. NPDC050585]|uniref:heme-binding protein n=1 Tax=Streptomyces sp. NPDC050585 TaxID=3365632 RepID=UPI0037A61C0D
MSTTTPAPLTTRDAETLVTAARRAAEAAGVTVSVTVLDAGGHPVHRGGRLVGAIGVGGGTPDQDHGFATAALAELAGSAR